MPRRQPQPFLPPGHAFPMPSTAAPDRHDQRGANSYLPRHLAPPPAAMTRREAPPHPSHVWPSPCRAPAHPAPAIASPAP
ncbi:hypothetical protein U9M48_001104 [Paspalum notatum var. saurae]|uniref:Uncharacterized protein n=1 Tax=Paspalum notatum var. saurae TaxID=547442 RepID=A0AAQ3PHN7_PASNO